MCHEIMVASKSKHNLYIHLDPIHEPSREKKQGIAQVKWKATLDI